MKIFIYHIKKLTTKHYKNMNFQSYKTNSKHWKQSQKKFRTENFQKTRYAQTATRERLKRSLPATKGSKSARALRRRNVNCNCSTYGRQWRHFLVRGTNLIQLIGKALEIGAHRCFLFDFQNVFGTVIEVLWAADQMGSFLDSLLIWL